MMMINVSVAMMMINVSEGSRFYVFCKSNPYKIKFVLGIFPIDFYICIIGHIWSCFFCFLAFNL